MVLRFLEPWCEADEAVGGYEALESLRLGRRPDLVLSDVDMPLVDGPSLFRSSMEERLLPRSSFMFMSGSYTGDRISFLLREKLLVMVKPFEYDYFMSAVESRLSDIALTRLRGMVSVEA